ncbi:hypothetical protein AVEN_144131-1 [Araneus ventricosus]|uniref:Uncharacterized protein n=1 Tax=Araneus ventricosus TaxID=182803 RepID=A0A4Y2TRW4_ARAVE|nr:hypothetical protein AVEN_144131-1 [Araneus ventricosus]
MASSEAIHPCRFKIRIGLLERKKTLRTPSSSSTDLSGRGLVLTVLLDSGIPGTTFNTAIRFFVLSSSVVDLPGRGSSALRSCSASDLAPLETTINTAHVFFCFLRVLQIFQDEARSSKL